MGGEYAQSFLNRCRECNLRTIEVDPTKPLDPNFPTENLPAVKQLFAQRIARIIANTNNDLVKSFFTEYAQERSISLPSDSASSATAHSDPAPSDLTQLTDVPTDSPMTEASTNASASVPSATTDVSILSNQ
jgi:hypothetical protein